MHPKQGTVSFFPNDAFHVGFWRFFHVWMLYSSEGSQTEAKESGPAKECASQATEVNSDDLTAAEMRQQIDELALELHQRRSKKQKYKHMLQVSFWVPCIYYEIILSHPHSEWSSFIFLGGEE